MINPIKEKYFAGNLFSHYLKAVKNQSKEKYRDVSVVIQFLPDLTIVPGPGICSGVFETSLTSPQGWLKECVNREI